MTDIKDRAREYLRGQTQLNGGGLFHCNILNLMLGFAEQETKELEKDKQYFSDSLDKQIEATLKLDKENAELDCQKNRNKYCYSCTNATEKCFKNEIGCPCDKYKSYKDENAELKRIVKMVAMINKDIYTEEGIKAIYAEAEQFLSCSEKPNN
jgi:hypothetical protein